MSRKKIMIFSLVYYPKHVGGAEVAIKEITDRIPHDQIEFHMVCNQFDALLPKVEDVGNVTVHRIGLAQKDADITKTHSLLFYIEKILFVLLAAYTAQKLHKKYSFDGFWAMMSYMVFPIVLLRMLGVKVPYVLTLQEGDPFEHVFKRLRIRVFSPLLKYGIKRATVVQTISHFLAAWVKDIGYRGTLRVVPNAVDYKHFSRTYSEEELQATRHELGKKEGDVFLVTTSRLVHKNGIDDVIRALGELPQNVHFVIFGTGPQEGQLRSLVKSMGAGNRVHFEGHIEHRSMPRYLKACDIFVRASRSEGMGNSFIEAMAAGLPVIGTHEGGIVDFLRDARDSTIKNATGWVVQKNSSREIANAVRHIIEHRDLVDEVVATAKTMVREKYDWDSISKTMLEQVFEKVLLPQQR